MLEIFVLFIKQGVGNLAFLKELSCKVLEIALGNVFHNYALWNDRIKIDIVGNGVVLKVVVDVVVYNPLDRVEAAARHVEVAAAEADVDLEELLLAVAAVVL